MDAVAINEGDIPYFFKGKNHSLMFLKKQGQDSSNDLTVLSCLSSNLNMGQVTAKHCIL